MEIDFLIERPDGIVLVEAKSAELVDPSKLNFRKVRSVLKEKSGCVLACRIQEKTRIILKDYSVVNPLYAPIPLDFSI